ncbi:hypothetical protein OAO01_00500 [Oligoflexia bacterium]|nr:hypothetical protein [Oligoflexia bacterium]
MARILCHPFQIATHSYPKRGDWWRSPQRVRISRAFLIQLGKQVGMPLSTWVDGVPPEILKHLALVASAAGLYVDTDASQIDLNGGLGRGRFNAPIVPGEELRVRLIHRKGTNLLDEVKELVVEAVVEVAGEARANFFLTIPVKKGEPIPYFDVELADLDLDHDTEVLCPETLVVSALDIQRFGLLCRELFDAHSMPKKDKKIVMHGFASIAVACGLLRSHREIDIRLRDLVLEQNFQVGDTLEVMLVCQGSRTSRDEKWGIGSWMVELFSFENDKLGYFLTCWLSDRVRCGHIS